MRARPGLAAFAGPGQQAMLGLGQGARQAVMGQQHIALIGLVGPAHGGGIGPGGAADLLRKALGQRLQAAGLAGQSAHRVQRGQALVLLLDAGGLLAHLALQILVRGLQRMCHQVEARGELAELVLGLHLQARAQLATAHRRQRLAQLVHGVDHQPVAERHEGHGRGDGECHQEQVKQVQPGRPAHDLHLDGLDKGVDLAHEGVAARHRLRAAGALPAIPFGADGAPFAADMFVARARVLAPGYEQRTRRVAGAQQLQAGLEALLQARKVLWRLGLLRQDHAQHIHAQAPGLVHRGRAAL